MHLNIYSLSVQYRPRKALLSQKFYEQFFPLRLWQYNSRQRLSLKSMCSSKNQNCISRSKKA